MILFCCIFSVLRAGGLTDAAPFLSGRVVDTDGHPVANAIVTDGFVHVRTDNDGYYRFESPYPERAKFVSVRIPADYRPVIRDGRTVFFSSLPAYVGTERTADIILEKRKSALDKFTMFMIADPQARPYSAETASENRAYATVDIWADMFSDLKNTVSTTVGECFGLCLGDIAASTKGRSVYSQYSQGVASLGIPFYQVIGNHDHFHANPVPETDDDSAAAFEAAFGPRNYSFDLGQFHFIILDNCIYKKKSTD